MSELTSEIKHRIDLDTIFHNRKYHLIDLPSMPDSPIILTNIINKISDERDSEPLRDFGKALVENESDLVHLENYYGRQTLYYENEKDIIPRIFSRIYGGVVVYVFKDDKFKICAFGACNDTNESILMPRFTMERIISPQYHSKGIGTELGKYMVKSTLGKSKYATVESAIVSRNIASIRSQEKISDALSKIGIVCSQRHDESVDRVIFSYQNQHIAFP